jgi:hypothetical protein
MPGLGGCVGQGALGSSRGAIFRLIPQLNKIDNLAQISARADQLPLSAAQRQWPCRYLCAMPPPAQCRLSPHLDSHAFDKTRQRSLIGNSLSGPTNREELRDKRGAFAVEM